MPTRMGARFLRMRNAPRARHGGGRRARNAGTARTQRTPRLRLGTGTPIRGGRPRRDYRLQPAGIRALKDARETVDQIWHGLKWPLVKARSIA